MRQNNQWFSYLKSMRDIDLIKIIYREQAKYEAAFLEAALAELNQREIHIQKFINHVQIRYNYSEPQIGTIEDARSKLTQPLDVWDVYYFTNIMDETLLVQHIYFAWVIHVFITDYFSYSFLIDNLSELDGILTKFIKLEEWESEAIARITDWEELAQLDSYDITENLIQTLVNAKIPFSVKKPDLPHFNAIFGTYYESSKITVVVPPSYRKQALELVEQIQTRIEQLQEALKISEAKNDFRRQIEIYTELEKLMPDDAILFFNKGSIFYELGEFEAAADALIQSLNIQVEKNQTVELDEIKNLLRVISTKSPENIDILHALAALARYEGDTSSEIDYYRQILRLDLTDGMAHLNLGYLYYHQEDGYAQAEYHFRQFLELEPEAENREAIEDLLISFDLKE